MKIQERIGINSSMQKLEKVAAQWMRSLTRLLRIRKLRLNLLLIIAFTAVSAPLLFGSFYAVRSLEKVSRNSEETVFDVVKRTRAEQALRGQLKSLERSIRQYKLFKDPKTKSLVSHRCADLLLVIATLKTSQDDEFKKSLTDLSLGISHIAKIFSAEKMDGKKIDVLIDDYERIYGLANMIAANIKSSVDQDAEALKRRSKDSQRLLLIGAILIVPLTVLLILFFTSLIGRSFRQIKMGITGLGDYDLKQRIVVDGPKDMRELGANLNWLRSRLAELEDEKQKFLRHMSHELKTPLANFQEGASLLADEIPGELNEKQKEVVQILVSNVHELKRHIGNLLDYNRIRFNVSASCEPFDLVQLIDEVLSSHKLSCEARSVRIEKLGKALTLNGDRKKIKTVVDNLVSNAVGFTEQGGVITIKWNLRNGDLQLAVVDDGPGLQAGEFERIFAPFYQGSATRQGPLQGSGIGLSVARECLKSIGGKISVENDEVKGAVFRIQIPQPTHA